MRIRFDSLVLLKTRIMNLKIVFCPVCFGVGNKEILVTLDKPELNSKGNLILYVKQVLPCGCCRLDEPEIERQLKIPV
jgi:hypothetical protein